MSNVKSELKDIIVEGIIPESKAYLEDLNKKEIDETITEDEKEVINDLNSFLIELETIIKAVDDDKITDEEAAQIYEKINSMINEHKEH